MSGWDDEKHASIRVPGVAGRQNSVRVHGGRTTMTTIDAPPRSQRRLHLDRPGPEKRPRGLLARAVDIDGVDTSVFWWLVSAVSVLNIIGLVMVLSASSVTSLDETGSAWTYFLRQLSWTVIGSGAAFALLHVSLDALRRYARGALALCLLALVAVHVPGLGVSANGATRWIGVGSLQIQPSEFTKLALILVVADWLARNERFIDVPRVVVRPMMLLLGVVAFLVMTQPNLGTTIVIAAIVFVVLFAAGVSRGALVGWGLLGTAGAVAAALGTTYRRARVLSFLDPWADPQHAGYQLIQSRVGLASGGIFGVGLGASKAKWGFLPFAHTDFIFAIVGEELGLVGASVVVGGFIAFGIFGIQIAARAESRFGASVAVGVTAWIVIQAFVNIGAVVGILPITGVPLPFLSYGGTSMVVTLAAVGLLLNVARHPAPVATRKNPVGASRRTADGSPGRTASKPARKRVRR